MQSQTARRPALPGAAGNALIKPLTISVGRAPQRSGIDVTFEWVPGVPMSLRLTGPQASRLAVDVLAELDTIETDRPTASPPFGRGSDVAPSSSPARHGPGPLTPFLTSPASSPPAIGDGPGPSIGRLALIGVFALAALLTFVAIGFSVFEWRGV